MHVLARQQPTDTRHPAMRPALLGLYRHALQAQDQADGTAVIDEIDANAGRAIEKNAKEGYGSSMLPMSGGFLPPDCVHQAQIHLTCMLKGHKRCHSTDSPRCMHAHVAHGVNICCSNSRIHCHVDRIQHTRGGLQAIARPSGVGHHTPSSAMHACCFVPTLHALTGDSETRISESMCDSFHRQALLPLSSQLLLQLHLASSQQRSTALVQQRSQAGLHRPAGGLGYHSTHAQTCVDSCAHIHCRYPVTY